MPGRGNRKGLTERQRAIWDAFRALTAKNGAPPGVRTISRHFRMQVSAAHRHLHNLVRMGYLEARGGTMRLPGLSVLPVPILGRISAGTPQEPLEAPEGYVPCPAEMAGAGRDLFALRVRGDSMVDAGILESDLVIVVRTEKAREGDIIVALLDGEATVKRLGKFQGAPALLPANPRYKPFPLKEGVRVIGRVTGVFRRLAG